MLQTVEAEIDINGNIRLLEPLPGTVMPGRVLVTLLQPESVPANDIKNLPAAASSSTQASLQIRRQEQMEWLKANAETYGGQYVALVGGQLICTGETFREANEAVRAAGQQNVFITYLPKPDEVLEMGGWL